jgi:hypothetical protein
MLQVLMRGDLTLAKLIFSGSMEIAIIQPILGKIKLVVVIINHALGLALLSKTWHYLRVSQ